MDFFFRMVLTVFLMRKQIYFGFRSLDGPPFFLMRNILQMGYNFLMVPISLPDKGLLVYECSVILLILLDNRILGFMPCLVLLHFSNGY